MKKFSVAVVLIVVFFVLILDNNSEAAGFALIEQSVSGLGNTHAGGAASAQDATTIFYYPAGLTQLKKPDVL